MRKLALLLVSILILTLALPALAASDDTADAIPEEVLAYAAGDGMRLMKTFMKGEGYVGTMFDSVTEIDALRLGMGFRLCLLSFGKDGAAAAEPADEWLFFLDGENGHAAHFRVRTQDDGSLVYEPDYFLCRLAPAVSLLERLCAEEGARFAPTIVTEGDIYLIAQDFGGDERIVTVPCWELPDPSYEKVKRHTELPTYAEYAELIEKTRKAVSDPGAETVTEGHSQLLKPRLDRTRTYVTLAIVGGVLLAAAAAALALRLWVRHRLVV